ncbi:MAG: hypothetical protein LBE47_02775 [Methanomassiliicoccaceae archaeon]|jgi:hypothetical protein|nr:hypothetical protein [Methanomassiliicoccaceae archaeon]
MAQRPAFLSIICILLAAVGLVALLVSVTFLIGLDMITDLLAKINLLDGFVAAGYVGIAVGLLAVVVAVLLWKGNKLGWFLVMLYLVLLLIWMVLSLGWYGLIVLIVVVLLIWYFLSANVKAFFGV